MGNKRQSMGHSLRLAGELRPLQKQDFFFVGEDSYDDLAERSLPSYLEGHSLLASALALPVDQEVEVIDLGAGTGVTTAFVLKAYARAKVVAVDLFAEMLTHAAQRLRPFDGRYELVQKDNSEYLRTRRNPVDAIVSAFCAHHLDDRGKRDLFSLAYDKIKPGGRFALLDLTTFVDPVLRELAQRDTIEYMRASVSDAHAQDQWIHHWTTVNRPAPADLMVKWMTRVGFSAEIVFRRYETALIVGARRD
jgi:tRNA (cmo5U34)-methyltransferase